eukprot:Lankesteria_metandrocarpae@DN4778_c0_g1_i3.p1
MVPNEGNDTKPSTRAVSNDNVKADKTAVPLTTTKRSTKVHSDATPTTNVDDGTSSSAPSCPDSRLTSVLSQAGSAGALGNLRDAIAVLEGFAKTEKSLTNVQRGRIDMSLGALNFAAGNLELASDSYTKAAEVVPNSVEPLEALALLHAELGESESEVREYEKCLILEPYSTKFKVLLARALLSQHITLTSEPHFAFKKGSRGLSLQQVGGLPDEDDDAYETAKAKYIEDSTERPLELLKSALEVEPGNIDVITNYSQALCIADKREEALKFLDSQVCDDGLRDDTVCSEYVQTAVLCGELEKAQRIYEKYYENDKLEFSPARLCAGCILQAAQGNKTVAVDLFQALLRTAPDKYEMHLEAGLHMTRSGLETELQSCLQAYVDKYPDSEAAYHYRSVFGGTYSHTSRQRSHVWCTVQL